MRRRPSGFSLVETMVAIALLGVIVVTVLSAFSMAALATSRHRRDTDLDRLVRSDAEYIKSQAYQTKPAVYGNLASPGYTFAVQVLYYDPAGGSYTAGNADVGLQEVVITATATSIGASERLVILKVHP